MPRDAVHNGQERRTRDRARHGCPDGHPTADARGCDGHDQRRDDLEDPRRPVLASEHRTEGVRFEGGRGRATGDLRRLDDDAPDGDEGENHRGRRHVSPETAFHRRVPSTEHQEEGRDAAHHDQGEGQSEEPGHGILHPHRGRRHAVVDLADHTGRIRALHTDVEDEVPVDRVAVHRHGSPDHRERPTRQDLRHAHDEPPVGRRGRLPDPDPPGLPVEHGDRCEAGLHRLVELEGDLAGRLRDDLIVRRTRPDEGRVPLGRRREDAEDRTEGDDDRDDADEAVGHPRM